MIPVVMKKEFVKGIIPDGLPYIAADDFGSPKALANHLRQLAKDKANYTKLDTSYI